MDERHEETKGERAWDAKTRRSISWVLYLSEGRWEVGGEQASGEGGEQALPLEGSGGKGDASRASAGHRGCQQARCGAGGLLRAYCRRSSAHGSCGAHQSDLQVGWLFHLPHGTNAGTEGSTVPVFLDAWVRLDGGAPDHSGEVGSALYRVGDNGGREYLTAAFTADTPKWVAACEEAARAYAEADTRQVTPSDHGVGMTPDAFAYALRSQLPTEELRQAFSSVEAIDHPAIDVVDVSGTEEPPYHTRLQPMLASHCLVDVALPPAPYRLPPWPTLLLVYSILIVLCTCGTHRSAQTRDRSSFSTQWRCHTRCSPPISVRGSLWPAGSMKNSSRSQIGSDESCSCMCSCQRAQSSSMRLLKTKSTNFSATAFYYTI
jgi:hypothetical protein